MKTDRGDETTPDTPDDDAALRALFARCEAPAMPETLEARIRRAHADASTSPAEETPLARLFDEHRDDVWSFVLASVRDPDVARDALEDAFFRAQRRLDAAGAAGEEAQDLGLTGVLACASEATGAVWTFLRKTGHADHPLADLDDETRALLLLRGGLGLGKDDLRRAGALAKDAGLDEARAAVRDAALALVRALPLPAHDGAPALARLIVQGALSRGDDLDLPSPGERARADEHVAACAPCALLRERARAAVDVPLRVCPGASEVLARVAERVEKDRAHRAAVDAVAARVSLACSYCHAPMLRGEAVFCAACLAPHHDDCFRDHGRCSAPGCGERAVVRAGGERSAGSRRRRVLQWFAIASAVTVAGAAAWTADLVRRETARQADAANALTVRLNEERRRSELLQQRLETAPMAASRQAEIDELRGEKNQLQDQNIELARRFDLEKKRMSDELDALRRASSLEERDAILAQARAEADDAAASDAEKLEALWAQLQALARARQVKPEDLVAEARQTAEARLEEEIEATFAAIQRQAEAREVEALVESFARLRGLMRDAEATPQVREKLSVWQQRLEDLGEVRLSIQLQVLIADGNVHLRRLADAVRREDWDLAEAAFAKATQIVEELRAAKHEVFLRNADALQLRADELIGRARALRELHRVKALITAFRVEDQDRSCVIDGRTYRKGDTVEDTTPAVVVSDITKHAVVLGAGGELVARVMSP